MRISILSTTISFEYGVTTPTAEMAANTIYIDGAVQGPVIDNDRRSYSFDHHTGCIRAFTLASCQQVAQALELGWDPRGLEVVVNDLDADTMVSVWLILHPERVREDRVRELVNRVGSSTPTAPRSPATSRTRSTSPSPRATASPRPRRPSPASSPSWTTGTRPGRSRRPGTTAPRPPSA